MCYWRSKVSCRLLAAFLVSGMLLPFTAAAGAAEAYTTTRSESVYVDMDPSGAVQSVVSSVYITNTDGAQTVTDRTSLTDIKNVLGNDKPKQEGDLLTFKAEGEDVCYQGTAPSTELPVSIDIAYTLNGQPITAPALAGKSGKVGITVKTHNHDKHSYESDGEVLELYTPFSIIAMFTLNERFSFIQTDHGRVNAEAGSVSVMAVLHPGLRESLGVEDAEQITDSLHIEADVKNFEMEKAMFIVMTGIVDENDLSSIDDVQEMLDGLQELTDAANDLYDGADEFKKGTKEFVDGLKEFKDGVDELYDGVSEYKTGITEAYFGTKDLACAAEKLAQGASELASGMKKMADEVKAAPVGSTGFLSEEQITQMVDGAMVGVQQAMIDNSIAEPELSKAIAIVRPAMLNIMLQQGNLTSGAAQRMLLQMTAGLTKLSGGASTLSSGASEFFTGAKKLADGELELVTGIVELQDGVCELQDGAQELYDGAVELNDGSVDLRDGIAEMRDEGLQKMVDETADINVSLSRKNALLSLSDAYDSFSGTDPDVAGSVQFIMTTSAVTMEKPIGSDAVEDEAEDAEVEVMENAASRSWLGRLWDRVTGWFKKK